MSLPDHYTILELLPTASQREIKQAYRRLVKQFHPDTNNQSNHSHEQMLRINFAYEVLGDPAQRQAYDQQRLVISSRAVGVAVNISTENYHQARQKDTDFALWLRNVYEPVSKIIRNIIRPLQEQIDQLAADPFDDVLLEEFQGYLGKSTTLLSAARSRLQACPNPARAGAIALNLYYCLNQIDDGLEDLYTFTLNFDDSYLHTGQELFRIATGLFREANAAVKTSTPL
ncbi:J domain-containing protein [Synechococcus sp. PCC 6312]|uniref:J domain-containing protein n=1 Tax=Synechococcus sp. (strain ATCC 27167 / PCC 6312) TaxID=195253 RepID=UPI00029F4D25|nr:J domain-containing protein [Synechococcus sp. PCC 6312]AFY59557.1 DnaJ-class molecular chaperone with C-terminal Zn finger domain [Synechococcus sp. PCC 6312]